MRAHKEPRLHEDYARAHVVKGGPDRSFGIVFCVVFAVIGAWPLLGGEGPRWWSLGIAAAFLVLALVRPVLLAPLNRLWLRFGLLLHRITSPIILFLMYAVAIVPMGLILRLLRKDLLHLRWDRTAASYWIERPPGPAPETMRQQF